MNIMMVRCPRFVLDKGFIGYGWDRVDFSKFDNENDLIKQFSQQYPNGIGRHTNNIKRYYNLKKGDIVIVPLFKSIAIGVVDGEKKFDITLSQNNACNLISVDFFKTEDKHLALIPRGLLTQGLESRLKLRTSIANLNVFKDNICDLIDAIKNKGFYEHETYILEREEKEKSNFKQKLLQFITSGKTWISAGGNGLERLVKELFEIEGYTAKIHAKNKTRDISDIDIIADKIDRFSETHILIQVKHHSNISGSYGIKQLIAINDYDDQNYKKLFITTADISEETKVFALENNIETMVGSELVDWIYENIDKLSNKTKQQLGIIEIPLLIH